MDQGLGQNDLVLDPWGGVGTTAIAARMIGCPSLTIDINPAIALIARARLLVCEGIDAEEMIASTLANSRDCQNMRELITKASLGLITDVEAPLEGLCEGIKSTPPSITLLLAAAMAAIRLVTKDSRGSNPTWTRSSTTPETAPPASNNELAFYVGSVAQKMNSASYRAKANGLSKGNSWWGHSTNLDLEDNSVSCVLTSPPYCTRIDYIIQTRHELELLGIDSRCQRQLREWSMGTPVISHSANTPITSDLVKGFVASVEHHNSYASRSYYAKFFRQYFSTMTASIKELSRVLKPGSTVGIVVQPSHFKEIVVDLPQMISSIGEENDLRVVSEEHWPARDMRALNTISRQYVNQRVLTESLIILRKTS